MSFRLLTCPQCGQQYGETLLYCPSCGADKPSPNQVTREVVIERTEVQKQFVFENEDLNELVNEVYAQDDDESDEEYLDRLKATIDKLEDRRSQDGLFLAMAKKQLEDKQTLDDKRKAVEMVQNRILEIEKRVKFHEKEREETKKQAEQRKREIVKEHFPD